MKLLHDKVALVTGASRGIGRGIARAYAEAGADLMLAARSMEDLEAVAEESRALGVRAEIVYMDAYDYDQVEATIDATVRRFGRLDVLVNNAGGSRNVEHGSSGLLDTPRKAVIELFELNLFSPYLAAKRAAEVMREQGGGTIINITSTFSFYPSPQVQPYSAAKIALQELTKLWAVELGPHKIRVNAIGPGPVWSAQLEKIATNDAAREALDNAVPLGRVGQPQDVGSAAVFLASDAAQWISGSTLLVSGGWRY